MEFFKTRREAYEHGHKWYAPGTRCRHGHVSVRLTEGGVCLACRGVSLPLIPGVPWVDSIACAAFVPKVDPDPTRTFEWLRWLEARYVGCSWARQEFLLRTVFGVSVKTSARSECDRAIDRCRALFFSIATPLRDSRPLSPFFVDRCVMMPNGYLRWDDARIHAAQPLTGGPYDSADMDHFIQAMIMFVSGRYADAARC